MSTFSQRYGYLPPEPAITIRDQAPDWLRDLIVGLAYQGGLRASTMRSILCDLLLESPDPNNWSDPNVDNEVFFLLHKAEWFYVYDFIEEVVQALEHASVWDQEKFSKFTTKLNDAFRRKGVGWQLVDGKIQIRGEESFEASIRVAVTVTEETGRITAQTEFHGALLDLSKRPNPDITGAIRHAMAALECVARDVTGEPNATLGEIIKRHPGLVPAPLDQGLAKMWGFASDQARHVREGNTLDIREAELLVGIAGSIATYLIKKTKT